MPATITTSAILCSWALEANLKWNTNVLAEWLDMDLNRKRKRKHYFQYGQVAGERATVACAMGAWKPQPMSSSQARRRLELSSGRERSAAATSMSWQASNANCIPNACVSHKNPKNSTGTQARVQGRQAGRQGRGCKAWGRQLGLGNLFAGHYNKSKINI